MKGLLIIHDVLHNHVIMKVILTTTWEKLGLAEDDTDLMVGGNMKMPKIVMMMMSKIMAIMVSGLALGAEYIDVVQELCGLQFEN